MPTPEELAAQEAEKAAQAAAEEEARRATEHADDDSGLPDDPKVLKEVIQKTRREAAARRTQATEMKAKLDAMEAERRKAEESALAEQGKFKELAESRAKDLEARVKELEEARAKLQTYEQREADEQKKKSAQVDAEFAALPEEIRNEFPGADQRTKEVAIRMYQKATGQKPRPPSTHPTAPRPATTTVEPPITPEQERVFSQIVGNVTLPREKRDAARAKLTELAAWRQQQGR